MPNPYFRFKQFTVFHDRCAMKVTTDACLFGAWCAEDLHATAGLVSSVLDIGTGSGLLSLMLAQQLPCPIDAVEIDAAAAVQAAQNFRASPWPGRLQAFRADIRVWPETKKYGCIISNPPFYENELPSPDAQRNTAHHSQNLKLGELLQIIAARLELTGVFYLLLPYKRKGEALQWLQRHALFAEKMVAVQASESHAPFRLMLQGGPAARQIPVEEQLVIRDAQGAYTGRFAALLKNYYLYL